jgi:hypothetical protein
VASAATEAVPPAPVPALAGTAPAGNWFTRSPAARTASAEKVAAETVPAEFMHAGFARTGSTADASREIPV